MPGAAQPMKALLLALSLVAVVASARAGEATLGDLHVGDAYARASIGMARSGAVYLEIRNRGGGDTLVALETAVAEGAMLHETRMRDGVMRMRHLAGGLPLPAGETVALAPGGTHIMLMGLRQPLREGERFPLTLRFEKAGEVEVEVEVLGVAAGAHSPGDYRKEGDHGHGQKMK